MTEVERVARAICKAVNRPFFNDECPDEVLEGNWEDYQLCAQAAIASMSSPEVTEEQFAAIARATLRVWLGRPLRELTGANIAAMRAEYARKETEREAGQ